jgi:hypothetical protein
MKNPGCLIEIVYDRSGPQIYARAAWNGEAFGRWSWIIALAAIAVIGWLSPGIGVRAGNGPDRRAGGPGHRRYRRTEDVPAFRTASHGASLQHGCDQEPGRRPIVKIDFARGPGGQGGRPALQIDPRPHQGAGAGRGRRSKRTRPSLVGAQADLERYAQLVPSSTDPAELHDSKKGADPRSCRPRSRPTKRRSKPPSSTSHTPISAHQSTDASAPGSSTRAISCVPRTTPCSFRSPR